MRKMEMLLILVVILLLPSPLCSFGVPIAYANLDDSNWLSGYGYRKAFNVTGNSRVQFNYMTTIMVHYGNGTDSDNELYLDGHGSKDFRDVRFTNSMGGLLKAQRGFWYPGDTATFLVTIPILPAAPNNATLYIYYDNPKASWRKYENNPVLTKGSPDSWENESVRDGCIVWNSSHYLMFYTGTRHPYASNPNGFESAIGLAISTDGMNWIKYSGNPVFTRSASNSWEVNSVAAANVLLIDGTYHMWYSADGSAAGWNYAVGYANSTDGINWVRYSGSPILMGSNGKFDQNSVYSLRVIPDGSTWRGLYIGQYDGIRTGYATAPNPWGPWTKQNGGNAVLDYTEAWERNEEQITDFAKIGNIYYGVITAGHGNTQMQVGMVKSTDLLHWTKDSANPVLETWAGTFDAQQLHEPHFLQMNDTGKWRIYYGGASYGGDYGNFDIGFAETDLTDHPLVLSESDVGYVLATVAGDVDGDGAVTVTDQRLVQLALFTFPQFPNWNPNADIDGDLDVDVGDMRIQQLFTFVSAEMLKLFVDPPTYVASQLGEIFTISIDLTDGQDLWAFEFKLAYSSTLLDVLEIAPGPLLPLSAKFTTATNEPEGSLTAQAYWFDAEAVNGNGTLATITVNVTHAEPASSTLDLYSTVLVDYNGDNIPHSAEDGTLRIEVGDQK